MVGQTVAHYEILSEAGTGGMGMVFKARDLRLNRLVALKFLPPQMVLEQEMVRLEDEARAISALNHPNIATIHGIEEADGRKFLVLEYVAGGTLQSKLNEIRASGRKLPVGQALDYAIQIALALMHAHRRSIVHLDIKPSNAMLTEEGTVKVTDFGLARSAEAGSSPGSRKIFGTPQYMSPEQAEGRKLDHRSDIFSLGVVLFELLAGELPFRAAPLELRLEQISMKAFPPLKLFRFDLPDQLVGMVSKELEKDRGRRYQKMDELLADLQGVRRTVKELSDQATTPVRPILPPQRDRMSWAALIAFLMVALVLFWVSLPAPKIHLAVLPFTNVGGDPSNSAFCEGLLESVTYKLAHLQQMNRFFWIVPASEVRTESVTGPRQAQRRFGATMVLTGSVQRTGGSVRVTANLMDARTLKALPEYVKDVALGDASILQDDLVTYVAE